MLRALGAALVAVVVGAVAFAATAEDRRQPQGGWFAYPAVVGRDRLDVRFTEEATAADMAEVVADLRDDDRIQSVVTSFEEHRLDVHLRDGASAEVLAEVISMPFVEDVSVAE